MLAIRLVGAAEAAFAVVAMLESWFVCAQSGKPLDPGIAPSEALDRREGILFVAESREAQKQKILPIIRTDAGGFFGFGELQPLVRTTQNRFQQLLSPNPPDARQQELARALLKTLAHSRSGGSDRR